MQSWGSKSHLNLAELTGALSLSEEPESYTDDSEGESYVGSTSTPSKNEGTYLKYRGKEKQRGSAKENMRKNIDRSSSSYEPEPGDPPAESLPQIRKRSTRSSTGGSTKRVGFDANVTKIDKGKVKHDVILTAKNTKPKSKRIFTRKEDVELRAAKEGRPIYPGER